MQGVVYHGNVLLLVLAVLCGACLVFLLDCYHADAEAITTFSADASVKCQTMGQYTVFIPDNPTAGFVFYPGAKVEHTAYVPLMQACASEGILCVLVEMPLYFPLIDGNAAEGIHEFYDEIDTWYIGGHSLGGYAASGFVADHTDVYDGLILLASYTSSDLRNADLAVLSIYGSEDQIMSRERYSEGVQKLPADYIEIILSGGCHAYFGMYDGQDGAYARNITNDEQIRMTAHVIADFIRE